MMRSLILAASVLLGCVDTRLPTEDSPPDRDRPDGRLIDRGSFDRGRQSDAARLDRGVMPDRDRGRPIDAMLVPDAMPPVPDAMPPVLDAAPPPDMLECDTVGDCSQAQTCFGLQCVPANEACHCRLDGRTLIPGIECSFWGLDSHRNQRDPRDAQGRTYAETRARYVVSCVPVGPLPSGQPCNSPTDCQGGICLFTGMDPHRCSQECADAACPNGTECILVQETGIQLCVVL